MEAVFTQVTAMMEHTYAIRAQAGNIATFPLDRSQIITDIYIYIYIYQLYLYSINWSLLGS